jgi:hypothetical protein
MPEEAAASDAALLIPLADAGARIGYSKASLYRFASEGLIELVRINDRTFVEPAELQRFVRDNAKPFRPGDAASTRAANKARRQAR